MKISFFELDPLWCQSLELSLLRVRPSQSPMQVSIDCLRGDVFLLISNSG